MARKAASREAAFLATCYVADIPSELTGCRLLQNGLRPQVPIRLPRLRFLCGIHYQVFFLALLFDKFKPQLFTQG